MTVLIYALQVSSTVYVNFPFIFITAFVFSVAIDRVRGESTSLRCDVIANKTMAIFDDTLISHLHNVT